MELREFIEQHEGMKQIRDHYGLTVDEIEQAIEEGITEKVKLKEWCKRYDTKKTIDKCIDSAEGRDLINLIDLGNSIE